MSKKPKNPRMSQRTTGVHTTLPVLHFKLNDNLLINSDSKKQTWGCLLKSNVSPCLHNIIMWSTS